VLDFGAWPAWGSRLAGSAATIALAWAIGHGVAWIVVPHVLAWSPQRHRAWVEPVAAVVRRRLPLWCLLIGVWLASGYWPLTPEARLLTTRAVFVVAAASVTLAVASVASRAVDAYAPAITPTVPVTSLTRNIAWGLVAVIGLLVVLNGLGLSIAPMLTALGVGGLAVALALQEPLANFFAGLFVTLAGQVRIGDYIRLDSGQEGYVVDFSWRSTRLRMLANNLVLVPNATLAKAIVINHHLPSQDLAVLVDIGVDYASDLRHVEAVTCAVGREVMANVPGGVPEFEPFIRYHTFGESSIDFTVILRAREFVDQYLIKHEFVKRLHARFEHERIVIPFPIRTLATRRSEETATRRHAHARTR
jgi:small-conductance mechanosensitive channel